MSRSRFGYVLMMLLIIAACHEGSTLPTSPQQWSGEFVAIALRGGDSFPLPDAVLEVRRAMDQSLVLTAKTGTDGRAVIRGGLPEGTYRLRFLAPPGYHSGSDTYAMEPGEFERAFVGAASGGVTYWFYKNVS